MSVRRSKIIIKLTAKESETVLNFCNVAGVSPEVLAKQALAFTIETAYSHAEKLAKEVANESKQNDPAGDTEGVRISQDADIVPLAEQEDTGV